MAKNKGHFLIIFVSAMLVILFINHVSALETESINEKINSIVSYAEQYEEGKISYMQLLVHGSEVREELREIMSESLINLEVRNETRYGFSEESLKKIFGKPAQMTNWLWDVENEKSTRTEKEFPEYRKIIFDGRKIQVNFNGWPQLFRENGKENVFYWIDFEIKFKKQFDFDIQAIISSLKQKAEEYNATKANGYDLMKEAVQNERLFQEYLQQNIDSCNVVIKKFFSDSELTAMQKKVKWEAPLYTGKNFDLMLFLDSCDGCDWPWVYINIEIWKKGPEFKQPPESFNTGSINEDEYRKKTTEELNSEIEQVIKQTIEKVKRLDNGEEISLNLGETKKKIEIINQILNERYNKDEKNKLQKYQERLASLDSIMQKYSKKIEKYPVDEQRYEKPIMNIQVEIQDGWCRLVNEIKCDSDKGCHNGQCILGIGGNEDCKNKIDDDGDFLIDCLDPDCYSARECGKMCQETCDKPNGCWKTNNKLCKSVCQECWNCKDGDESCRKICEKECWPCSERQEIKDACQDCWTCEDEAYGGCHMACLKCNDCNKENKEGKKDCSVECEPCGKCGEQEKVKECEKKCRGDERCKTLCLQGEKEVYMCDGKESNTPCNMIECGKNSNKTEKGCECFSGFYNCDNNWLNGCESNEICPPLGGETCSNQVDDDNDGLVDCEDISDCENKVCSSDFSNSTEIKRCIKSKCELEKPKEKAECEEGQLRIKKCEDEESKEIIKARCIDGKWAETEEKCKEEGTKEKKEPEKEVKLPYERTENKTEEHYDEKGCVIREDCGGENMMCSNGRCKEIVVSPEKPEESEKIALPGTMPANGPSTEKPAQEPASSEPATPATTPSAEPTQAPIAQFFLPITKVFEKISGMIVKDEKCKTNKDCNANQGCDSLMGRCYCERGFIDCDGTGDGSDENGCESKDVTCGGTRKPCGDEKCNANQECSSESGHCECISGFYDCDGDWFTGCESSQECRGCKEDKDCAPDRCDQWNNIIQDFGCYKDKVRIEELGRFQLSGACIIKPTGKIEGYISFDVWGKPFEELQQEREKIKNEIGDDWCRWEIDNAKKERQEIESSFNEEFLRWFFKDYVNSNPEKWEQHASGVYDAFWRIVENSKRTSENLNCMNLKEFPDYKPINIEYSDENGHVKIWEEKVYVKEMNREMLVPYMQIWIFPTKEFVKKEIKYAMEKNEMPGPKDEKSKELGPTEAEKQKIKENPEAMKIIKKISDAFGGDARANILIKDGEEKVGQIFANINPDIIIEIKPGFAEYSDIDMAATINFNWLYEFIRQQESKDGGRIESPSWATKKTGTIKELREGVEVFGKIINAIQNDNIKLEPKGSTWKLLKLAPSLMKMMSMQDKQKQIK
jgi:hypothetical protein